MGTCISKNKKSRVQGINNSNQVEYAQDYDFDYDYEGTFTENYHYYNQGVQNIEYAKKIGIRFLEYMTNYYNYPKNINEIVFYCRRVCILIGSIYPKEIPDLDSKPPSFEEVENNNINKVKQYQEYTLECINYVSSFVFNVEV